jgi:hypothetical protein
VGLFSRKAAPSAAALVALVVVVSGCSSSAAGTDHSTRVSDAGATSPATPAQVKDLRAFAFGSIEAAVQLAPAVIGEAGGCAHWGVDQGPARYRRCLAQRSALTENIDDGPDMPGTEGYDLLRETLSITDDLISTMAVVDGTDRHCKQALHDYLGAIGVAERANDTIHADVTGHDFAKLARFATQQRAEALRLQFSKATAEVSRACF